VVQMCCGRPGVIGMRSAMEGVSGCAENTRVGIRCGE
jgi:hypothetical protein